MPTHYYLLLLLSVYAFVCSGSIDVSEQEVCFFLTLAKKHCKTFGLNDWTITGQVRLEEEVQSFNWGVEQKWERCGDIGSVAILLCCPCWREVMKMLPINCSPLFLFPASFLSTLLPAKKDIAGRRAELSEGRSFNSFASEKRKLQ